jgi:hypothetical protein
VLQESQFPERIYDSDIKCKRKVAVNVPFNEMVSTMQHHKNNLTMSLSLQELQEVRNMSRKLQQLKRQMFLKQVEGSKDPSPVNRFRSLIVDLAVEEEAKEAFRLRSNSISPEGTLSGSSSFDYYVSSLYATSSSMGDLHRVEE